jgi:hypothetical protein
MSNASIAMNINLLYSLFPGAWVISGGTNSGVMKLVGEAVRDCKLMSTNTEAIAIGISTWSYIQNRDNLENDDVSQNSYYNTLRNVCPQM